MRRRDFLTVAGLAFVIPGSYWVAKEYGLVRKITPKLKSKEEWQRLLDREAFGVLFEDETEPPYASPLLAEEREGTYICAACYLPLFESKAKYDSGTGWPSFVQPIPGRIDTVWDFRLDTPRREYHCSRCGGHQGHVFDDGPPPTGRRWCNNGVALLFIPAGEDLPLLRP
jgi:peptide-methionine (R)-S-oxide reductase